MSSHTYDPFRSTDAQTTPFRNEEEVWFWFMGANQARLDGATTASNSGGPSRPCEPIDILRILDRLYRSGQLTMDHFRILRHYGERLMAPDRWKPREARAAVFWKEAMLALRDSFLAKGIIEIADGEAQPTNGSDNLIWMHEAANRLAYRWGAQ